MSDWTQVFEGSRLQCDLVAGALEAHGLEVLTPGGSAEYAGAVFENSVVWVRTEMAPRAREIIEAAERSDPSADA